MKRRGAALVFTLAFVFVSVLAFSQATNAEPTWKAGLGVEVITPTEPTWMAGYAARKEPGKGKIHDLYVKVLALEDPNGKRLVILTSDLIGLSRSVSEAVIAEVVKTEKLPREAFVFASSHTHCGPVVRDNLEDMYEMPDDQRKAVAAYGVKLQGHLVNAICKALADLKPATLAVGQGQAGFAVNRRKPTPQGVINDENREGPVDHSVPVLRVSDPAGKVRAILFGYACHNTTLAVQEWCGDYAGFAQIEIEKAHPGSVALFWTGCGADANPLPRRTLELCQKYGKELATAVDKVLADKLTPVAGKLISRYGEVALDYEKVPDKVQLQAQSASKTYVVKTLATRLLTQLEKEGKLPTGYPQYPVQVVKLGDQVVWVALGGEVVVDYSIRLRKELGGGPNVWVGGYFNDVMAYIPSERVLQEGGYEGESSQLYYGHPSKWAKGLEEKIVARVKDLAK